MKAFKSIRSFFRAGNKSSGGSDKADKDAGADMKKAFNERFKMGEVLGSGNFSVVKEAEDLETGEHVAVKVMSKKKLSKEDKDAIKVEVDILSALDHPHIIKLYGMFEDKNNFYVVTELVKGGELFDRIVEKEFYNEADAAKVVRLIAEALHYCNENGVVHRDLKPENVLLTDPSDDASIKLADFGFAKEINPDGEAELKTTCGTPGYVAPEIISGKRYGKEVDMWSLGVITYILLCGYPPFYDENQANLFKKIKKGEFAMHEDFWGNVSEGAKSLVNSLLTVDSSKRLTVEEVIRHPWVEGGGVDKDITPALDKLRRYQARKRLKKAARVVMAANRMKNLLGAIEEAAEAAEDEK